MKMVGAGTQVLQVKKDHKMIEHPMVLNKKGLVRLIRNRLHL